MGEILMKFLISIKNRLVLFFVFQVMSIYALFNPQVCIEIFENDDKVREEDKRIRQAKNNNNG